MPRSGKILILNKEGIVKKISYERRDYESDLLPSSVY